MKDKKKEFKICFILHSITACLFTFSGVVTIVSSKSFEWYGLVYIAAAVTFASTAFLYFKRYKKEKENDSEKVKDK